MKRLLALLLVLVLLAGCGKKVENNSTPQNEEQRPVSNGPLPVYLQGGAVLPPSLEEYAVQRGLELRSAEMPDQAAVCVLAQEPAEGYLDLGTEPALRQLLQPEGALRAVSGEWLEYGYCPNKAALEELLGAAAMEDIRAATYAEWADFVKAVGEWIRTPARREVKLDGSIYLLPESKGPATGALVDVFAIDCVNGYGEAYLGAALVASGGRVDAKALTGPLNSLWTTARLESDWLAGDAAPIHRGEEPLLTMDAVAARRLFEEGKALFLRTEGKNLLPIKFSFDETDIGEGAYYTLEQLLTMPVAAPCGWVAISQEASEYLSAQGLGYILWLVTTGRSGDSPLLTMEQSQAINNVLAAQLQRGSWDSALRKDYVAKVLAALK